MHYLIRGSMILNYVWNGKRRLDTDRLADNLKLILTKDHPSTFHSSDKDREAYDRWHAASSHVKKFVLASVGNSLGWIDKLDWPLIQEPKWFDEVSAKSLKRLVVSTLRKTVLKENQNMSDYVVEFMDGFDRLEALGGKISPETQQLMILDGLPKSYEEVKNEILYTCWPTSLLVLFSKLMDAQIKMRKMKGNVTKNFSDPGRESDMAESSSHVHLKKRII